MLEYQHPHPLKHLPEAHPAYPIVNDLVIVDFPPGRAYDPDDDAGLA